LDFKQDFERRLSEKYGRSVPDSHVTERYDILGEMVRDYAGYYWRNCREDIVKSGRKQCIYFSMEFLIGRLLVSNMQNLGIYNVAKDGLAEMGIDINELEEMEPDAGLGNGGLGRLGRLLPRFGGLLGLARPWQHHPLRIWLLPSEIRRGQAG
jgi:starch phosphorylase